jgi:starch phosphorylase
MKAALNGAVHLSVLDGWWAEAFDGANGWAIESGREGDEEAQDARDAARTLELLEKEVVPSFYDRDADGVPTGWIRLVKASMRTAGLHFTTRRMLRDYLAHAYATG